MDDLKTLIFRTDRIGDFLISCPFIISYRKKNPKNKIYVVSSEYNYSYIKNFHFIDKVISLKNENKFLTKLFILLKIVFLLKKEKFDDIIVLDGKKRSFFIAFCLKGKKTIFHQSQSIQYLSKLLNYTHVFNYIIQNQIKNFSYLANIKLFNINHQNINIYENYNFEKKYVHENKYILLHLDEKWFTSLYYKDFEDINPSEEQLETFVNKILNILPHNYDLIISTGNKELDIINRYVKKFKIINKQLYNKEIDEKKYSS